MVDEDVTAGNKVIAVTGNLNLIGVIPKTVQTRLIKTINPGATSIEVGENEDWKVGDELMISPTEKNAKEFEKVKIKSINGKKVGLFSPIKYFHYGSNRTIPTQQGPLDMRAKIAHLTRNIQITVYFQYIY